jgi:hypothetical protein
MSELAALLQSLRVEGLGLRSNLSVRSAAYSFMMRLIVLGLLLEAERSRRPEIQAFLDETAPHFDREVGVFMRFVAETVFRGETGLSDDPTRWKDMCNRRSALAFFVELYASTALAPSLGAFQQDYLDTLLRAHANNGYLTGGDIPAHMPARHWWWWLPHAPPA